MSRARRILGALLVAVVAMSPSFADDWPEWRGAGRGGVWNEDGILEKFPDDGLRRSWSAPIREGYAGPAVAAGRVFVADFARGEGLRGTERALCLDEQNGKVLWTHEWPVNYAGTQSSWANGPRTTPTVDDRLVYFQGAMGHLVALEAATGKPVWQHDYVTEFGSTVPPWGFVGAPLVDGKRLIALVGGEDNALVVAFDKTDGKELWRALPAKSDAGYAAPILVEAGGKRQLIVWHPLAVSSLDPLTGKTLWQEPHEVKMGMTVATPVFDRGRLLVSSFFDGALLLKLDAERPAAERAWYVHGPSELPDQTRGLHALIATPILDGETIYGIDSYGELRGLRAATGERIWQSDVLVGEAARWAAGLIVRHGDRYFVNTDRGDLVIARFTPQGYREIDRTHLIEPTTSGGGKRELNAVHWSHPAYANRHIVVRNDREIVRFSLAR